MHRTSHHQATTSRIHRLPFCSSLALPRVVTRWIQTFAKWRRQMLLASNGRCCPAGTPCTCPCPLSRPARPTTTTHQPCTRRAAHQALTLTATYVPPPTSILTRLHAWHVAGHISSSSSSILAIQEPIQAFCSSSLLWRAAHERPATPFASALRWRVFACV